MLGSHLWKYVCRAEYDWHSYWVAEHNPVWSIPLDRAILLMELLSNYVKSVFMMHVPHEPQACP
jgi:hypothetical protein